MNELKPIIPRKRGIYERYVKRILDIICSCLALMLFGWLYIAVAIVVRIKIGSPVFFNQLRPGIIDEKTGREKLFNMYKFRTMTNETDNQGNLRPDEERLIPFGAFLRSTSLDELPEVINILKGDMSIIGPRPQLVRDMVFMDDNQRLRHTAKPGLSGLAQVKGRNLLSWDEKFKWDMEYIKKVSFINDLKIVLSTIKVAIIRHDGITNGNDATAIDYGDTLLNDNKISNERYNNLQQLANRIINEFNAK